jgi:mono/diheme cytochrome c family protein
MRASRKDVPTAGPIAAAILAVACVVICIPAWAQEIDKGRTEFMANCARCHGTDGRGSGPNAADLKVKPADLTALAKRTNGRFDPGAVYQMIDGRNPRFAHRSADMPIWGCRHREGSMAQQSAKLSTTRKHNHRHFTARSEHHELESLLDLSCDSDALIQERILSIVGYLSLIQEK